MWECCNIFSVLFHGTGETGSSKAPENLVSGASSFLLIGLQKYHQVVPQPFNRGDIQPFGGRVQVLDGRAEPGAVGMQPVPSTIQRMEFFRKSCGESGVFLTDHIHMPLQDNHRGKLVSGGCAGQVPSLIGLPEKAVRFSALLQPARQFGLPVRPILFELC